MMTYEFDEENAVIHLRASGTLVASDPINYFQQLDADSEFRPKAEERVYFTELEDIAFSYSDILLIKHAYQQNHHGEKLSRVIFITDSDLSFGMARMVVSIFGEVFEDVAIERLDQ